MNVQTTAISSKITSDDLKVIMLQLAEKIMEPDSFTNEAVSLNAEGKGCSVFSSSATQCDLFGLILKLCYAHWGRKVIGQKVSEYIDSHIRHVSGGELRLMTLSDLQPRYASRYLIQAANALHHSHLPKLFAYAKDYKPKEGGK